MRSQDLYPNSTHHRLVANLQTLQTTSLMQYQKKIVMNREGEADSENPGRERERNLISTYPLKYNNTRKTNPQKKTIHFFAVKLIDSKIITPLTQAGGTILVCNILKHPIKKKLLERDFYEKLFLSLSLCVIQ